MTDWNVIFFRKNRTKNHASTWKPIRPCIHVSLQSTAAANAVRHMYQPHIASHQVRVNLYLRAIVLFHARYTWYTLCRPSWQTQVGGFVLDHSPDTTCRSRT